MTLYQQEWTCKKTGTPNEKCGAFASISLANVIHFSQTPLGESILYYTSQTNSPTSNTGDLTGNACMMTAMELKCMKTGNQILELRTLRYGCLPKQPLTALLASLNLECSSIASGLEVSPRASFPWLVSWSKLCRLNLRVILHSKVTPWNQTGTADVVDQFWQKLWHLRTLSMAIIISVMSQARAAAKTLPGIQD